MVARPRLPEGGRASGSDELVASIRPVDSIADGGFLPPLPRRRSTRAGIATRPARSHGNRSPAATLGALHLLGLRTAEPLSPGDRSMGAGDDCRKRIAQLVEDVDRLIDSGRFEEALATLAKVCELKRAIRVAAWTM